MKTEVTLLQILPRAPADCGGVGDYAGLLAARLREWHGIDSTFLSAAPACSQTADGFSVLFPLRAALDFVDHKPALLLHYVNYGYGQRGAPPGLPSLLRRLKRASESQLVTIFHELYAAGTWRQSAFWLRPVQREIVRAIARLSFTSIVSNEIQGAQLERLAPGANIILQPVSSNFGEPARVLSERDPGRWIICGGNELIERSLDSFSQNASFVPSPYPPRELFVVGGTARQAIRARLSELKQTRTYYHPEVDARVAGEILSTCTFAWIDYFHRSNVPLATILKSSVFAAFCAHGVIPVFPHDGSPIHLRQDVMPGPFFVTHLRQHLPAERERGTVAQSLHDWYQRNASWQHLTDSVVKAIRISG